MPAVTYVVSAYDRPSALLCCLASIAQQTDQDFEVIVADNNELTQFETRAVVSWFDERFKHANTANATKVRDCYWAAEWIVDNLAQGEWLCFPSDDSYYVPVFQETLLSKGRSDNLGLVYCDMLYDRRIGGRYSVLNVQPASCAIDKTGFLLRRDAWIGFPNKPQAQGSSCCDGEMVAELVRRGVRHGKVEECLVVHN